MRIKTSYYPATYALDGVWGTYTTMAIQKECNRAKSYQKVKLVVSTPTGSKQVSMDKLLVDGQMGSKTAHAFAYYMKDRGAGSTAMWTEAPPFVTWNATNKAYLVKTMQRFLNLPAQRLTDW